MKVLFLTPPPLDGARPAERIFGCNYGIYHQPNLFVLYPATILKQAGHDVRCADFPAGGKGREDFTAFFRSHDFELVFFYTVFLSKRTDIQARDWLGSRSPETRFVFMASEPTASPEDFLDEKSLVIRGEPETRVLRVVEALGRRGPLDSIPGISYALDGRPVHQGGPTLVEDLDSLPFPDRTLLDSGRYENPKLGRRPFTTMIASRGCRFGCYYCVPNSLCFAREIEHKRERGMGKPPVRVRSAGNVIREFTELAEAGYRAVSFIDDQFVWGRKRTLEICEGIEGLGVEWSCLCRADMLQDRDLVTAMARAGCRYVDMGIESFNQEILDFIGKDCSVESFYRALENLKEAGIEAEINLLLGSCPLETKETVLRSFQETLRLDVDYVLLSVCTPFPYTRFHERAREEGWMIRPEYEPIDPMKESFISYPHLTKKDLDRLVRRLYVRFYFRPSYVLKRVRRLRGVGDLLSKGRAALSILRT